MRTYYEAIRKAQPNIPIQVFGGHSHIRDFAIYDQMTTALESGRYCETVGWFSMSGLQSSSYQGCSNPSSVPNPVHLAISSNDTNNPNATNAGAYLRYSRRYLDWNRLTLEYHATGSQTSPNFDTWHGVAVTYNITNIRNDLHIKDILGCAPQTWCMTCVPFGANESIYSDLVPKALSTGVVNQTRADKPRILIVNSGGIRFDLVKGPFTIDDSYIVSPFADIFVYIPAVPYHIASKLLNKLNTDPAFNGKRDLSNVEANEPQLIERALSFDSIRGDDCKSPSPYSALGKRALKPAIKRRHVNLTPGYTTVDDLGSNGKQGDFRHTYPTKLIGTSR